MGVVERPKWLVKNIHVEVVNKVVSKNSFCGSAHFTSEPKNISTQEQNKTAEREECCFFMESTPPTKRPPQKRRGQYNSLIFIKCSFVW